MENKKRNQNTVALEYECNLNKNAAKESNGSKQHYYLNQFASHSQYSADVYTKQAAIKIIIEFENGINRKEINEQKV